ncbi:hypothetical protein GCM10023346_22400 [Arthrobacter gyeryongensis]|uniref:Uncharacterized protein n=1 Tax=Arthrobacter gyeryongensis TaxID=1650592 RepID=A0ABP9SGQ4_9MICC
MDHSQRLAAKIALDVLADDGFLLAGGQALIEHGITERLSDDTHAATPATTSPPTPSSPAAASPTNN